MVPDLYCCSCGKLARCVVGDMHLVPERAFADCYGPLTSCPPPDDGGRVFPDDSESPEEEEPEPNWNELNALLTQYPD